MNVGGNRQISKIIRILIMLPAKIKPGLRILMHEQRSKRTNVPQAIVFERASLPGIPGLDMQRIRNGSQSQQVHHHQLAVVIPAIWQEADFWSPSMRQ